VLIYTYLAPERYLYTPERTAYFEMHLQETKLQIDALRAIETERGAVQGCRASFFLRMLKFNEKMREGDRSEMWSD